MEPLVIEVKEVIGSQFCVRATDGMKVYEQVQPALKRGNAVVLSFNGVELVIAAFLNHAVGKLYKEFPPEYVETLLSVKGLNNQFYMTWHKVHGLAPHYFAHEEVMRNHIANIIEE